MEMEICLFVFADDGTVTPLDKDRFERAVAHMEPLAEFSGRCIKLAGAVIDRSQGAAVVQDVYGQYVYFDEQGMVDEEKLTEAARYAGKVAEEGYQNEFVWTPSADDRAKIEAVLIT